MSVPVLCAREALAVASELGEKFAKGAAERDANRALPTSELEALS